MAVATNMGEEDESNVLGHNPLLWSIWRPTMLQLRRFVQQVRPDVRVEDLDVELHKPLLPFEGISEDHIFS